jgi:hypothetical protein
MTREEIVNWLWLLKIFLPAEGGATWRFESSTPQLGVSFGVTRVAS